MSFKSTENMGRWPSYRNAGFVQPVSVGFWKNHLPFFFAMRGLGQEHYFWMQGEQMVRRIAKSHPRFSLGDCHIKLRIGDAFVQFDKIIDLIVTVTVV